MKKWFFLLFFFPIFAFSEVLYLRDEINHAKEGDFVVTMQNRCYSLVHFHTKTEHSLVIEEITAPISKISRNQFNWQQWINQGAPGHTSWVMYAIDPKTGKFQEYYSFTHRSFIEITPSDHFFHTLLNLKLRKLTNKERRLVKHNVSGGTYKYSVWHPRLVFQGKVYPKATFNAYEAIWPNDGSELSNMKINVFLPSERGPYPGYFPYWIQLSGNVINAKVRIVDSGVGLTSPIKAIPRSY